MDTFVDKSLTKYKFCGILLSTWENFSGQVLYLSFLIVPISAIFGVIFEIDQKQILYTGAVGIVTGSLLIFVDKTINLSVKKQMIRLNLLDYLENFCKVRLEHQTTQPELLEQYRQEYSKVINKKTNRTRPEHEINEINRRKEARRKKEEEKRLNALKREEEQKRIEAARREEERKKMEERKMLAARRREEELRRLQEEREALALRREELRKRAEEKKRLSESKLQDKSEKEKILSTIQEELRLNKEEEEKQVIESIEEIAAELEDKDNKFKREPLHSLSPGMSAEEERLIEDVLREFFA